METLTIKITEIDNHFRIAVPGLKEIQDKDLVTLACLIERFVARISKDDAFCVEMAEWCKNNPINPNQSIPTNQPQPTQEAKNG